MRCPTHREFLEWLGGLSFPDRTNFVLLLGLPSVVSLLASMPEGKYRQMTAYALAYAQVNGLDVDDLDQEAFQ